MIYTQSLITAVTYMEFDGERFYHWPWSVCTWPMTDEFGFLKPTPCGKRTAVIVDGVPRCKEHAKQKEE
jgi:hypothetical protein